MRFAILGMLFAFALPCVFSADKDKAQVQVGGADGWVDTNIDLRPGDSVSISATGTTQFPEAKACGPEGLPRGWKDLVRILAYNDAGRGTLIGRIGDPDTAMPFPIGAKRQLPASVAGRLFLRVNRAESERPTGSYTVDVTVLTRAKETTAKSKAPLAFTQAMLDALPSRVEDAEGNLGDRVNFIVIGSERALKDTLDAAGWVLANRTKKDAVIQATLASLSKQAYTQLPMSELRLFGRPQDFGYAHADPLSVVASRHHFRLWKAAYQAGGQDVWIGAGTHDIGFDRDRRNNGITHKIDPDTDKEREYIAATLNSTGLVSRVDYLTPKNPLKEAQTATGATFNSDGRTLIITLGSAGADDSTAFASLFCSVLASENPDGGEWGECAKYFGNGGIQPTKLGDLRSDYRLLIVPGILNTCASNSPAFQEGQVHLKDKHGIAVELLAVPNDSSESNAKLIASYLKEHSKEDARKYIVLGYSKGAPDLQVALASDPSIIPSVAALVTVAGAVGGSPIADLMPPIADKWVRQYGSTICKGDLSEGFKSLRRSDRRAFLQTYATPVVPTYSIAAVSDKTNTSKMLLETWQLLTAFGSAQDGQLILDDAIIPGAKYLGEAHGDHFSVGLPFVKHDYPRGTLLEAIYRYISADLGVPH